MIVVLGANKMNSILMLVVTLVVKGVGKLSSFIIWQVMKYIEDLTRVVISYEIY